MTTRPTPALLPRFDLFDPFRDLLRAARALRAGRAAIRLAHERNAVLAGLDPDVLRDVAMSPDEATGIGSYQPALPFFMQAGFGGRE